MYTLPQLEVIFISVFGNWTARYRARERESKSKREKFTQYE